MLRIILCFFYVVCHTNLLAKSILVKNMEELNTVKKVAIPGDTIVLQNGIWNNVTIILNEVGTKEQPIVYRAQTNGGVTISGNSKLFIGGQHIVVDGWFFTNGYSGKEAVINFRNTKKQVANHCRVTNTIIDNYNNAQRLEENYWIAFYGKHNRLDHCTFSNKKNIGVLIAVILDEERSRQNNHSIDHNYFNGRTPLASNGGEIIRVGVSEHCTFQSNTSIANNYFYQCDGETEIISIKSCNNLVEKNVFKECQGSVVLRHGNDNIVSENLFLGNNKQGTGGVRVINKGQWVVNNYFYKCIGENFRSPIAVMNGVPNSPANRYVAAADAVIANNSFIDCGVLNFCVGSDEERSEIPSNVYFINNLFENKKEKNYFVQYDSMTGFIFKNNLISKNISQPKLKGFTAAITTQTKINDLNFVKLKATTVILIPDSIQAISIHKLGYRLSNLIGFTKEEVLQKLVKKNASNTGASWQITKAANVNNLFFNCVNEKEVIEILSNPQLTFKTINLTGLSYHFIEPLVLMGKVTFNTAITTPIQFYTSAANMFYITAGSEVKFNNIHFKAKVNNFITTDSSGNSNHSSLTIYKCIIETSANSIINLSKKSLLDKVIIDKAVFKNGTGTIIDAAKETDKKGYYNIENIKVYNCIFKNWEGAITNILRTGNDESTMGPTLVFSNNKIDHCNTTNADALIHNYGVQYSFIQNNHFSDCNVGKIVIQYTDIVRARHVCTKNKIVRSGSVFSNKFTELSSNREK